MKNYSVEKILSFLIVISLFVLGGCVNAAGNVEFVRFSECPDSPNCVSSFADPLDEEHYIQPYIIDSELTVVFQDIVSYLEAQPRVKIIELENDNYIHAVFMSKIFRFKDDVEFGLKKSSKGDTVVDIASRSRLGHSDLGVNRARMEELREALK